MIDVNQNELREQDLNVDRVKTYNCSRFRIINLDVVLARIRQAGLSGQLVINLNNGIPSGFAEWITEEKE